MKDKGYVSASTLKTDEYTVAQLEQALKQEEVRFDLFRKFTAPKTIRELEGVVLGTQATLDYQKLRSQRHLDRLKTLERQVDHCTILRPARRLCHLRQRPSPRDLHRRGDARPPESEAVLPARPDRHGGRRPAQRVDRERGPRRDAGPGPGRRDAGPAHAGPRDQDRPVPVAGLAERRPLLRGDRQAGRTDPGPQARHDRATSSWRCRRGRTC